jgi:hypothetical protein
MIAKDVEPAKIVIQSKGKTCHWSIKESRIVAVRIEGSL